MAKPITTKGNGRNMTLDPLASLTVDMAEFQRDL